MQGRLWLKGLPEDSYVLQHGTFPTVKQAKAAMNGKDWLVNARVIPVFSDGKDEAEFALVTGPFRTKDRAQNTVARLKLSNNVSLESSAGLYKQALPPKTKPYRTAIRAKAWLGPYLWMKSASVRPVFINSAKSFLSV